MNSAVLTERRGGVAILTMNLPKRRNALAPELYRGLADALAMLRTMLIAVPSSSAAARISARAANWAR
jgi:enoyl-CoA hydratase/carnithine racemase